jgi:hypothetical protein
MEAHPDRLLQKHFLCRDYIQLAKFALSQSKNVVTPEIEAWAREVVKIYREHFLGKGTYLNTDTLQYYSAALSILNEGSEFTFSIGTDEAEQYKARLASVEEAKAEVSWRIEHVMTPRLSPWW